MKERKQIEGWEDYQPITIKLIPFEPQPEPIGMAEAFAKGDAVVSEHKQAVKNLRESK